MCDINWLVLPDSERLTWTKELKHFLEFSLCWLETKFLLKKMAEKSVVRNKFNYYHMNIIAWTELMPNCWANGIGIYL